MRTSLSALSNLGGPIRRRAAFRRRMGLSGVPQPMLTRGFKDGRNSWIDVMPSPGVPAMRITHTIGADLRKPPSFGLSSLEGLSAWGGPPWAPGQGPKRAPRAARFIKCVQSGVGNVFCWNTQTGEGGWAPTNAPASGAGGAGGQVWVDPTMRPTLTPTRPPPPFVPQTSEMKGFNCRAAGSGKVFCWDDELQHPNGKFYAAKGFEGLGALPLNQIYRERKRGLYRWSPRNTKNSAKWGKFMTSEERARMFARARKRAEAAAKRRG